jgi:hypothetical protein
MSPLQRLDPCFVHTMPAQLDEGKLYISMEYCSINHLCACGCGSEVVTPLHPARWAIFYNGDTVSLWPSVGSFDLPCRSHYVIERNRVVWQPSWSEGAAREGVERDRREVERFHAGPADSREDRGGWMERWSRRVFRR